MFIELSTNCAWNHAL